MTPNKNPHDDYPQHLQDACAPKVAMLAEAQNWRCAYCGVVMIARVDSDPNHPDAITVDEVHARAHGGRQCWSNQVAACRLCNNGRRHYGAMQYLKIVSVHGRVRAPKIATRRLRVSNMQMTINGRRLSSGLTAPVDPEYGQPGHINAPQFGIRGPAPVHEGAPWES